MKPTLLVPAIAAVASIALIVMHIAQPEAAPSASVGVSSAVQPMVDAARMPPAAQPGQQSPPAGLTSSEWEGVVAQIRAEQRAFQPGADQHLHAVGAGGESLQLSPDGTATVSLGEKRTPVDLKSARDQVVKTARVSAAQGPAVDLSLRSMAAGREAHRQPVATAAASATGKHLAERKLGAGVTEWWRSDERGFEFGWNIDHKPEGDGRLRMEMAVDCPWPGAVEAGGRAVAFSDPAGSGWRLACRGLVAKDATGRTLPAAMDLAGDTLSIEVDDADATYPVVIDPWIIAEAPVTVNAPVPDAVHPFGGSVTLGGDTLAVTMLEQNGGPSQYHFHSFRIFTREGSGYTLRRTVPFMLPVLSSGQPAAICGDTVVAGPFLGVLGWFFAAYERNAGGKNAWASVQEFVAEEESLSSIALDTDTLVLGSARLSGPQNDRVKIYRRDPANLTTWLATPGLTGMDLTGVGYLGFSLNLDGPTLLVGSLKGVTTLRLSVFRESGGHWQFDRHIPGIDSGFYHASLSGDTLVLGDSSLSEVRIHERDAGGPNQWGLVRSLAGPTSSSFGDQIALDGDLLVVSASLEDIDHDGNAGTPAIHHAGVVRSYGRHTGGYNAWGQTGIIHKGLAAKESGEFGEALSLDGGRLAVGYAKGDSVSPVVAGAGVVEIYTASSGTDLVLTVANPQAVNGADFGAAVALDGPYLLVGAPLYDPTASSPERGAAFLFRDRVLVQTWFGQSAYDHFGRTVAIHGDRVAIGAPKRAGTVGGTSFLDLGSVYVYERNQGGADIWGEAKVLVPDVSTASDEPQFGASLALSGDSLVVGSPYETPPVGTIRPSKGRARVFQRNQGGADNWGQVKLLSGTDAGTGEIFGFSVDISGDTVAVGAPGETVDSQTQAGAAYVFRRNQGGADNWGRVTRLPSLFPASTAFFGYDVALDGNHLAIGTPGEALGGVLNAGAAHLYSTGSPHYDEWLFDSRLQPEDLVANHQFGISLDLSGGLLVVGAPNSSAAEPSAGAVWLYGRTDDITTPWEMLAKHTTSGPDELGMAVAIDGGHFVAGDPTADVLIGGVFIKVDRGEVYEWTQTVREWVPLRSRSGGSPSLALGSSVALLDDLLVAGAPMESVGGQAEAGVAYVFRKFDLSSGGWLVNQRLTDTAGNLANAHFGSSLAMDSQWLAVGSPGAKRVSLFTRGVQASLAKPWTGAGNLTVSPSETDGFGTSLAMADGRLLVGAPQRSGGGAAFLFARNQGGADLWGQIDVLTASDAAIGDAFGTAVALNSGVAVVGAPFDDHAGGTDAGSVYLFSRNNGGADTWGQSKKLTVATQAAGDELGSSVAIADYLVLAGMPGDDTPLGSGAGSAVLFARNFGGAENYGLLQTFTAPDGNSQARFGTAVALDTSHAIVSAPYADPGGRINVGELYVYSRNYGGTDTWGLLQVTAPEELPAGSQFGMALALDRNTFAAGAPFAPMGQAQGVVEIYTFRGRTLYDEWAAGWGLHGSNGDPMADADGDGQENILELYLGSDPGDGGSIRSTPPIVSGSYLLVTFPKACACQDLGILTGETSNDLQTWTPATPAQIRQDSTSFLQLQIPVVPGQKKFVRFRVEVP